MGFIKDVAIPVIVFAVILIATLYIFLALLFSLDATNFQRRDKFVQECLQSERYTREECILLAGE